PVPWRISAPSTRRWPTPDSCPATPSGPATRHCGRPWSLTNVLGPALLAHAALPHLEATGGRLVPIGSVAGLKNSPANLYSATKWATTGLAENLRLHATTRGIGVTLVNPGMIDTPFWQGAGVPPFALPPQPVAEAICFALDQPATVDLNTLTIRPMGQPV
ncbi:LOW QUALITY PROTEIN: short-chain dehydrogenase/reductase family oxidoreductase, partial [Streptomyces sp. e14]